MTAPQHFRSALNGFNREDVVNYIAYITNNHETQLNQFRSDLAAVQAECEELRAAPQDHTALEEELAGLKAELEERDRRIQELEQLLEEATAAPVVPVQPQQAEPARWSQEELNAYRRAESVERRARERVNQMVDKANGTLAEASVRLENATNNIAQVAQQVRTELEILQAAVGESQTTLANTAVIISAIRVDED